MVVHDRQVFLSTLKVPSPCRLSHPKWAHSPHNPQFTQSPGELLEIHKMNMLDSTDIEKSVTADILEENHIVEPVAKQATFPIDIVM